MDGQSLESEFEEQNHNMSSYGDVRVPPYLHSGLVAVITVLSFLASVILFFAFYHLVLAWKLVNNLKKRSKNATRFEDGIHGIDNVEERGDLTPVERLREDSVLIHDAVFHDSLYDVTQDPKPEPSPAPSIFTEEAFYRRYCPVWQRQGWRGERRRTSVLFPISLMMSLTIFCLILSPQSQIPGKSRRRSRVKPLRKMPEFS